MSGVLDLPIWVVGVIVVGGATLLGVLLVFAVRPIVQRYRGEDHNQVFSDGFAAVGTMYAIVAGLLVFGVFTTFDEATQESADQASTLILMYREAEAFPQPQRDQAQQAVVAYLNSVIDDEWPAMAAGERSPATSRAVDNLFAVYSSMEPDAKWSTQYDKSIDHLDDVVKSRYALIDHSTASLPLIYWFLLFAGAFITILYLSLSHVENRLMHSLAVGLMAAMLGLVIFLLLEVNHPFRGEVAVTPEHFQQALERIDDIAARTP